VKHKPEIILQQISRIQQMERGKLCRMRRTPTGDYYNHQTWDKERNVVRYVPRNQVNDLKTAIAGYQQFLKLTQAYAEEVIRRTRQARKAKT